MRLGVHVSAQGNIYDTFARARALQCATMQFFARNPQQWRQSRISCEEIQEFRRQRAVFKIEPVFIHIPYLLNLASVSPKLYQDSLKAFIEDMVEAQALGADYIVTHLGSFRGSTERQGLARFTRALGLILERTKKSGVGILLENTAGSGSWLGYTLRHHQGIIRALHDNERIGLCFDTAHAYAAGFDLATAKGLDWTAAEIEAAVGKKRLKLVHLNDTREALGSRRDRHEHIGKGNIGLAGMRRLLNHPFFRDCNFILETPKDSATADKINLNVVRELAAAKRRG